MRRAKRTDWAPVLMAAAACALGACHGERSDEPPRQFFPDMDDQYKVKAQGEMRTREIFKDGRTMREPVAGTVPFGQRSELEWGADEETRATSVSQVRGERADILKDDDAFYRGFGADGKYVATIPIPVTMQMMRRGEERFNIYCTPCHGYTGDGKGLVGVQWSYALPSFHDPKYMRGSDDPDGRGTDGFLFHTMRHGVPNAPGVMPALKMQGYAAQVDEHDAWAIVAYIRALQRSRATPVNEVPDSLQAELRRMAGAGAPSGTRASAEEAGR
ncbi:cytochrome c [Geitlerinema splendidum]|nr:cytochrome c [Geitlerinema splendidum]